MTQYNPSYFLSPLRTIKSPFSIQTSIQNSPYIVAYIATDEKYIIFNHCNSPTKKPNERSPDTKVNVIPIIFSNALISDLDHMDDAPTLYCSIEIYHYISKNFCKLVKELNYCDSISEESKHVKVHPCDEFPQCTSLESLTVRTITPISLNSMEDWSRIVTNIHIVWNDSLEKLFPTKSSKRSCAPYLTHDFSNDSLVRMHLLDRYIPSIEEVNQNHSESAIQYLYLPVKLLNETLFVKICLSEECGFIDEKTQFEWLYELQSTQHDPSDVVKCDEDIFAFVGGYKSIHQSLKEKIDAVLLKETAATASIIIHGADGTGKSTYGKALANLYQNVYNIPTYFLHGSKIWRKMIKEIEEADSGIILEDSYIDLLTNQIINQAPSLLVIDDFEIVAANETSNSTIDQIHMLSALRRMLDGFQSSQKSIVFIAISRNIEQIDSSLRTSSRLAYETYISIPDSNEREEILNIHFTNYELMRVLGGKHIFDKYHKLLSDLTPGYVGRDIEKLVKMVSYHALARVNNLKHELLNVYEAPSQIIWEDVLYALESVPPSQISNITSTSSRIPKVNWSSVQGYTLQKKRCRDAIFGYMEQQETYEKLGMSGCTGILLYGPTGCGKTLLSQALASEGKMNFFSVKCPELFSKYFGETEATIRSLFRRARQMEPCVLLFDEIDALAQDRSDGLDSQTDGGTSRKALVQLLTEMDGIQTRGQLVVVGCTNRRDEIDEALLRPGRMDLQIEIPLPTCSDRYDILKSSIKCIDSSVDIELLAKRTEGMSGADLSALCREASLVAIRRYHNQTDNSLSEENLLVTMNDYLEALNAMKC